MKKTRNIILFISLLFATLYVPLSICIYSPICYDFNSYLVDETINESTYEQATANLRAFFIHNDNLDMELYNEKELMHMSEVRNIYDSMFILFILSLIGLYFTYEKRKIKQYTKSNIIIVLLLLVIIPIFVPVWYAMHSIFFSNTLWLNTPEEISYYIFSDAFFRNTMIFVIIFTALENFLVFLFKGNRKHYKKLK